MLYSSITSHHFHQILVSQSAFIFHEILSTALFSTSQTSEMHCSITTDRRIISQPRYMVVGRAVASVRPLVPGPPFEIGVPHLTFGSPVAAYIPYCISKMWPPLLVFGPSFWFLAPPAAKSWRPAWLLVDTESKIFVTITKTELKQQFLHILVKGTTSVCELLVSGPWEPPPAPPGRGGPSYF